MAFSTAGADSDFPRVRLDNGILQVSVYLPDAQSGYYRGTRFDWAGIVESVEYDGHRFFAPLHPAHDPLRHDSVSGPADEFAMFEPMGYAEAAAGESFVKVGVGLLAKSDDEPYRFDGDYRLLRPGEWRVETGRDHVVFSQELIGERGWAYRYQKRIRLTPGKPEMVIDYRLENSGRNSIDINHYNHNFILIDDMPYGPNYSVELPFAADAPRSINDLAWFRGNRIEVERPLARDSLWIELYNGEARGDYNAALVRNDSTGAAIEFSGSAAVDRFVFWAVERAACPEPFSRIYLQPGESSSWSTRYRFISGKSGWLLDDRSVLRQPRNRTAAGRSLRG